MRFRIYVGPCLNSFVGFVEGLTLALAAGAGAGTEDKAGGRVGDELDGDDGVEVGDVGRVWGENVIEGGEGGSRVVEVVI